MPDGFPDFSPFALQGSREVSKHHILQPRPRNTPVNPALSLRVGSIHEVRVFGQRHITGATALGPSRLSLVSCLELSRIQVSFRDLPRLWGVAHSRDAPQPAWIDPDISRFSSASSTPS
jgi:hypothetical protein